MEYLKSKRMQKSSKKLVYAYNTNTNIRIRVIFVILNFRILMHKLIHMSICLNKSK